MTTPTCEWFGGKIHDENPPPAVVEVVMEWDTSDRKRLRRTKNLCEPCYLDKAEETCEQAGLGKHSILTVQTIYRPLRSLPLRGSTLGRRIPLTDVRSEQKARKDTA